MLKDNSTERNLALFNTFSEKFDDFKAQLEQSASQRSDNQDGEINTLKASLNDMQNLLNNYNRDHTDNYRDLYDITDGITANITAEITRLDGEIDFIVEKSVKQEESIKEIKKNIDDYDKQVIAFKKRVDDTRDKIKKTDNKIKKTDDKVESLDKEQTKRVDDLDKTITDTTSTFSEINKEFSDIINNKMIYQVPLIHLQADANLDVKIIPGPNGSSYEIGKHGDYVRNTYILWFFRLYFSPVLNYNDYIKMKHDFDMDRRKVTGFLIKKDGTYYIDIKLIGDRDTGYLLFWRENYRSKEEDRLHNVKIEKTTDAEGNFVFKDVIKQRFLKNTSVVIIPGGLPSGYLFTIKKGSYVRFTYSWEPFSD